ncbi:MAG: hypothetical protein KKB37_03560, partial [Alphaproteobacteria bacterium]|nr:hypothetical protein [Alphaproteobacteria bacterium]
MFKPNIAAASALNRHSDKRSDDAFIAAQLTAPLSRFIVLVGDKPIIDPTDEGQHDRVRWFTLDQLREYGFPVEQSYFLGTHPADGGGRFALAVSEHMANTAPDPVRTMRPAVDLRSLAMQGALIDEELSTIGMAKALSHWH